MHKLYWGAMACIVIDISTYNANPNLTRVFDVFFLQLGFSMAREGFSSIYFIYVLLSSILAVACLIMQI